MSRIVGVLGGMGPAATADFFARVVAAGAGGRDQDHVRLIIDNNPHVPDRNAAARGEGPSPGAVLADMARGLERAGAQVLVMPCNAAHAFEAEIRAATPLPFVGMIDATVDAVAAQAGLRRIGLLAADGCLEADLYQSALRARGLTPILPGPAEQARFMALIYRIKAGDSGEDVRAEMRGLAESLLAVGAQGVVAGCTEVPLVLAQGDLAAPLVSSTDVLVARTLAVARQT